MDDVDPATVRPDHPVAQLSAAIGRWAAEAPAGERTGTMLVDVLDSIGRRHGHHELTTLQAGELAAALADADWCTRSADAFMRWLGPWRAAAGVQPAAQLVLTDWNIGDAELDWGDKPAPVRVPIGAEALGDLTKYLVERLELLLMVRKMIPIDARWQEGQRVRVHPGLTTVGRQLSAHAGKPGVVVYIHVSLPRRDGEELKFFYQVRLDEPGAGQHTMNMTDDELVDLA